MMEYYDYRHSDEYNSEGNSSDEEVLEEDEEIIDGRESNQHFSSPLSPQRLNRITGNPGITAFIDAVTLGPDDVEIYAYNKKELVSGSTLLPIAICTKRDILEAASPILRDLLKNNNKRIADLPDGGCRDVWDYCLADSDLEFLPYDDFEASWQEPPTVISKGEMAARQREVVFVPFGAARTWKALVSYLCTGSVSFRPIRSLSDKDYGNVFKEAENHPSLAARGSSDVSCSPKSLYALAKKLELPELAKICEEAIFDDLHRDNIIKELFSRFTWRWPEILDRQLAVFMTYSQDSLVRTDLEDKINDGCHRGALPVVLNALLRKMLLPVSTESVRL